MNKQETNEMLPLYSQVRVWILEQINKGVWKPEDLLPSERELAEQFQISRMTVRQAITLLVNENVLLRKQGSGTYVAEKKIGRGNSLFGFSEEMKTRGMNPGAIVCEQKILDSPPYYVLDVLGDGSKVFSLTRLRLADEKPMAIETSMLSMKHFPEIDQIDFNNQSLYKILSTKYLIDIDHADQTIEVGMPTPQEAELLQINYTIPVFRTRNISFDDKNQAFEFAESVYRGDRYQIHKHVPRK